MQLTTRGAWPGPIVMRQGWSKAIARAWNDDVADAQLRLVRGGRDFIASCADRLLGGEAGGITSPPLPEQATRLWRQAGFGFHLTLDLFSADLLGRLPAPEHPVLEGDADDWEAAVDIDRRAFDPTWRLGDLGLREARAATSRATFLVVRADGGRPAGFAIAGVGGSVAYLQRVAVHPDQRGRGYGRSLVRACRQWGRARGGRTILLNTQPSNEPAAALYQSEGFHRMASHLQVLRYPAAIG